MKTIYSVHLPFLAFNFAPLTAVQLQGIQELLVLLVRPPLALLGNGIWLPRLFNRTAGCD